MGRWDSDDDEDTSNKGGGGGGGGGKPGSNKPAIAEKRKAPVIVGDAAAVYAFFQEEDWKKFILLDVRPHRDFAASHVCCAFCVSIVKNSRGRLMLEDTSSKESSDSAADEKRFKLNRRRGAWSDECWMGRPVVVYGSAGIKEDHPVVSYLQSLEFSLPKSITLLSTGFETFANSYPGLTSSFPRPRPPHRYPAEILPGKLYLGDWKHAQDAYGLEQLGIARVITIHQDPESISFGYKTEHMRITQDDTDTAAITAHFDRSFAFIDSCKGACLVHCGAGISRSATLVIAYMMRKSKWPLDKALKHVQACRSAVRPNNGFMQALRDFESSPESGVLDACASAVLSVYKGDAFVEDVKLKGGKCLAGRAPDAHITTEHPSCSRNHACLDFDVSTGELTIEDLGSAHGTTLDGSLLPAKTRKRLVGGSTVVFGASSRRYVVKLRTPAGSEGGGGGARAMSGDDEREAKRQRVMDAVD